MIARLIPCEVIVAAVECLTISPIYQESLTQRLAEILVCEVTLSGSHGGVITETIAGDP